MAITSTQLYIIAAVLGVLSITIIISFILWYLHWKKENSGFSKLKQKKDQMVNQRTPKIKLSTVEFNLPQGALDRPYKSYQTKNEYEYHMDEKLKRDVNKNKDDTKTGTDISTDDEKGGPGVQTTMGLLKPELYGLNEDQDIDLYEDLPPGNIGRIWFSLEYDVQAEKLIVNVDKICNLPGRQQRSSTSLSSTSSCDPFIRLYLLPDEKRYLQSKMKRKTTNPVFKETFMFTMSYNLLVARTLRITIFDVDRFMRQTVIGHVLEPLNGLDITMVSEMWRDLEKSSQLCNNLGRLQIGLTHFPALNRVAVNIIRGQNIGNDDIPIPDCYVKITYSVLSKVHKVKKTSVQKSSTEPFFNQTVEFKIDKEGLDITCLNFEIYHNTPAMVKNDKLLGSFIVGGALCTRGKELEHWQNMMLKRPSGIPAVA